MARSRKPKRLANALAVRARIVLASARGESNTEIAERLGFSKPTVGKLDRSQRILAMRPGQVERSFGAAEGDPVPEFEFDQSLPDDFDP